LWCSTTLFTVHFSQSRELILIGPKRSIRLGCHIAQVTLGGSGYHWSVIVDNI
ncbi:hypothetical protein EUTSA_v10005545mg, partial [Eutrema salsugineum]